MNDRTSHAVRQLWIRNGSILLVEFVLLAISIWAAFIPMGGYNTAINMAIAGIMALIGLLFFMDLIHGTVLLRLAAVAGFFWLIIMFPLTLADYFTRAG
ncbi:MAG: oxidase [Rhodomicrobium sp.]